MRFNLLYASFDPFWCDSMQIGNSFEKKNFEIWSLTEKLNQIKYTAEKLESSA